MSGLTRARALAKTAAAKYAEHRARAEAAVVRWQWCSKHITTPEPYYFEGSRLTRGRKLPGPPAKRFVHEAEEGYDAEGRILVIRQYAIAPSGLYETFYQYEPGGIASIRYHYGTPKAMDNARWFTTEAGRVLAIDSVYRQGHRSRVYRFDERGHYAGYDDTGTMEGAPVRHSMDIECDASGRAVRLWWTHPGTRKLYWEHSSVKGKAPPPATAKPAATATKTAARQGRTKPAPERTRKR